MFFENLINCSLLVVAKGYSLLCLFNQGGGGDWISKQVAFKKLIPRT